VWHSISLMLTFVPNYFKMQHFMNNFDLWPQLLWIQLDSSMWHLVLWKETFGPSYFKIHLFMSDHTFNGINVIFRLDSSSVLPFVWSYFTFHLFMVTLRVLTNIISSKYDPISLTPTCGSMKKIFACNTPSH